MENQHGITFTMENIYPFDVSSIETGLFLFKLAIFKFLSVKFSKTQGEFHRNVFTNILISMSPGNFGPYYQSGFQLNACKTGIQWNLNICTSRSKKVGLNLAKSKLQIWPKVKTWPQKAVTPLFPYILNQVNDPLLPPLSLFLPYVSLLLLLNISSSVPAKLLQFVSHLIITLNDGCYPLWVINSGTRVPTNCFPNIKIRVIKTCYPYGIKFCCLMIQTGLDPGNTFFSTQVFSFVQIFHVSSWFISKPSLFSVCVCYSLQINVTI